MTGNTGNWFSGSSGGSSGSTGTPAPSTPVQVIDSSNQPGWGAVAVPGRATVTYKEAGSGASITTQVPTKDLRTTIQTQQGGAVVTSQIPAGATIPQGAVVVSNPLAAITAPLPAQTPQDIAKISYLQQATKDQASFSSLSGLTLQGRPVSEFVSLETRPAVTGASISANVFGGEQNRPPSKLPVIVPSDKTPSFRPPTFIQKYGMLLEREVSDVNSFWNSVASSIDKSPSLSLISSKYPTVGSTLKTGALIGLSIPSGLFQTLFAPAKITSDVILTGKLSESDIIAGTSFGLGIVLPPIFSGASTLTRPLGSSIIASKGAPLMAQIAGTGIKYAPEIVGGAMGIAYGANVYSRVSAPTEQGANPTPIDKYNRLSTILGTEIFPMGAGMIASRPIVEGGMNIIRSQADTPNRIIGIINPSAIKLSSLIENRFPIETGAIKSGITELKSYIPTKDQVMTEVFGSAKPYTSEINIIKDLTKSTIDNYVPTKNSIIESVFGNSEPFKPEISAVNTLISSAKERIPTADSIKEGVFGTTQPYQLEKNILSSTFKEFLATYIPNKGTILTDIFGSSKPYQLENQVIADMFTSFQREYIPTKSEVLESVFGNENPFQLESETIQKGIKKEIQPRIPTKNQILAEIFGAQSSRHGKQAIVDIPSVFDKLGTQKVYVPKSFGEYLHPPLGRVEDILAVRFRKRPVSQIQLLERPKAETDKPIETLDITNAKIVTVGKPAVQGILKPITKSDLDVIDLTGRQHEPQVSQYWRGGTQKGSIDVSNARMKSMYVSKHSPALSLKEQKAILTEYFGTEKTATEIKPVAETKTIIKIKPLYTLISGTKELETQKIISIGITSLISKQVSKSISEAITKAKTKQVSISTLIPISISQNIPISITNQQNERKQSLISIPTPNSIFTPTPTIIPGGGGETPPLPPLQKPIIRPPPEPPRGEPPREPPRDGGGGEPPPKIPKIEIPDFSYSTLWIPKKRKVNRSFYGFIESAKIATPKQTLTQTSFRKLNKPKIRRFKEPNTSNELNKFSSSKFKSPRKLRL